MHLHHRFIIFLFPHDDDADDDDGDDDDVESHVSVLNLLYFNINKNEKILNDGNKNDINQTGWYVCIEIQNIQT